MFPPFVVSRRDKLQKCAVRLGEVEAAARTAAWGGVGWGRRGRGGGGRGKEREGGRVEGEEGRGGEEEVLEGQAGKGVMGDGRVGEGEEKTRRGVRWGWSRKEGEGGMERRE